MIIKKNIGRLFCVIDLVNQVRKKARCLARQAIWTLRVALPFPAPGLFENKPQFLWAFFLDTDGNYTLGKAVLLKDAKIFRKKNMQRAHLSDLRSLH